MKVLKIALLSAIAMVSSSASAATRDTAPAPAKVSTCYYQYTVIIGTDEYDVYNCYSNGDGSY